MKSVDVSVIVPVYNVEQYFPKCLDSLKEQELENIEFILVDDGSPDSSPEMCEEIALEDDRFIVIHKSNGGQSRARNTAISISNGEYLAFVDSDDYVLNQPFLYGFSLIKNEGAEIVVLDNLFGDGKQIESEQCTDFTINSYSSYEVFNKLCDREFSDSPWNKLFKRELFDSQYFDEGVLNEDFLLLIKMMSKQIRVVTSNYIGYYYFVHSGSTSGSGFKKNMIDALYNAHYAYENIPSVECKKSATEYFLFKILMFMINMPSRFISEKNKDYIFAKNNLKTLQNTIKESSLSNRNKYLLKLFCKHPKFTKSIVDKYMKGRV